jgi:two-component system chemotaxis response regulator CheY
MPKASELKVIVVDDQGSMRGIARYSLEQLGIHQISEAADAKRALDEITLPGHEVGLILSDYNMPDMDGLAFLRAVRAHPVIRKTPFIMMTGRGDKELVTTAAKAGVSNYIIKPFNTETIKKKIEAVLGALT